LNKRAPNEFVYAKSGEIITDGAISLDKACARGSDLGGVED
jgi:hypothetical protein